MIRPWDRCLCVCHGGRVRSVALRYVLTEDYGVEALACGVDKNSGATIDLLCRWASKIFVLTSSLAARVGQEHHPKLLVVEVGVDRWGSETDPELRSLLRAILLNTSILQRCQTPKRAYLVCGAPASGNRLVAAILARSGCHGHPSTEQLSPVELPDVGPCFLIDHYTVESASRILRGRGFVVAAIMPVREPIANARSMVAAGHVGTETAAHALRINTIATNIRVCQELDVPLEIVVYEQLTEQFLSQWLPKIGLPYVSGALPMVGQDAPTYFESQNGKHYK